MIMSVSTLTIGSGAAAPVRVVNFCMGREPSNEDHVHPLPFSGRGWANEVSRVRGQQRRPHPAFADAKATPAFAGAGSSPLKGRGFARRWTNHCRLVAVKGYDPSRHLQLHVDVVSGRV